MAHDTEGELLALIGASRTGKTATAANVHRKARRLSVWDPKAHWARKENCVNAATLQDFVRLLSQHKKGPLRVALTSTRRADFERWAELSYWWCRMAPGEIVGEEVGNVTNAVKAVDGWHLLLSQGLEFIPRITVISQRVQETDKTAIGNASRIRCFRQEPADAQPMARRLAVEPQELIDLENLRFIERNLRTRETIRGKERVPRHWK